MSIFGNRHVLMCGGGGGGGGGGPSDASLAANDSAQFGTSDAPAGALGGFSGGSNAPSGPATGLVGSAMYDKPLVDLTPVNIDPNAGKVATVTPQAGGATKAPDPIGSLPTAGSLVAGASGSKALGGVANVVTGLSPLGPVNAGIGLANLGISAINELGGGKELKSGDIVTTDTVTGGTSNAPAPSGKDAGGGASDSTGIINGAMNSGAPSAPAPQAEPAPAVNYSTFGKMDTAGWSRAGRRFANAKKGTTQ